MLPLMKTYDFIPTFLYYNAQDGIIRTPMGEKNLLLKQGKTHLKVYITL